MSVGAAPGPSRLRRRITVAVGLTIAILWIAFVATELRDRANRLGEGTRLIATAARLLEEHARSTLMAPWLLLEHTADRAAAVGVGPPHMQGLTEQSGQIGVVEGMIVLDAAGAPIGSHPPAPGNYADRRYFIEHRDGAEVFVGGVIESRLTGENVFTISRRLADESGRFAGVAVIGVRERQFTRFYDSLDLPNLIIRLFAEDGRLITAEPPRGPAPAGLVGLGDDGADHLMAYRRLGEPPLVVVASLPRDAVLAGWRADLLNGLGMMVLGCVVLLVLHRVVQSALAKEHDASEAVLAANRDLSRTVAQLDAALAAAERAERAKAEFLSAITHDVSQPFKACRLLLEAAEGEDDPARLRELMTKARVATELQGEMLGQLVRQSLLDQGAVEPVFETVPLWQVVAPVLAILQGPAALKGLELRAVPCSVEVSCDPALLRRMVMNLVNNAVRYTERGKILVGCRRGEGEVWIEVLDQGCGIPSDRLRGLFGPQHGDGAGDSGLALGLGMGLAVVDALSRMMDLRIEADSRPGRGSRFRICVPMSDDYCEHLQQRRAVAG